MQHACTHQQATCTHRSCYCTHPPRCSPLVGVLVECDTGFGSGDEPVCLRWFNTCDDVLGSLPLLVKGFPVPLGPFRYILPHSPPRPGRQIRVLAPHGLRACPGAA